MSDSIDRFTGRGSEPQAGWSGRWALGATPLLDPDLGSDSRDQHISDDLEAITSLSGSLDAALSSRSWLELLDVPLLADVEDDDLALLRQEQVLTENLPSIARICERFITRLGERSELMSVSRVKRPARKAFERLSGHTEDWAGRTLTGPIPRRALAITRDEDADLYENRMVAELVHPILTTALADRIRRLRRLSAELAVLARAKDEGTHLRRDRLYRFWGANVSRVGSAASQTADTLRRLESLVAWIQALRGSTLLTRLVGRRTGLRSLRITNVIANDLHYRFAGHVWTAYERDSEAQETPEERTARLRARHRTFDTYVLGLLVRALDDLGYQQVDDSLPDAGQMVEVMGPWGKATLHRDLDGVFTIRSHGRTTRFVPSLDLVGPHDDADFITARWTAARSEVEDATVVVYLAASERIRSLPDQLATGMLSAGTDAAEKAPLTGVPVSPLETTSLERVARAVAIAVLSPALEDFPIQITLAGEKLPRRLVSHVSSYPLTQNGLSPLLHQADPDVIALRRPLTSREVESVDQMIRALQGRTRSTGWERDLVAKIDALKTALLDASARATRLLRCPGCGTAAESYRVAREGDILLVTCACEARWGHERCGSCGDRIAFIDVVPDLPNPEVTGPGWVERIYGQDALASPCWARSVPRRYVCPTCRACSVSGSPEGNGCVRCHP